MGVKPRFWPTQEDGHRERAQSCHCRSWALNHSENALALIAGRLVSLVMESSSSTRSQTVDLNGSVVLGCNLGVPLGSERPEQDDTPVSKPHECSPCSVDAILDIWPAPPDLPISKADAKLLSTPQQTEAHVGKRRLAAVFALHFACCLGVVVFCLFL